MDQIRVEPEIRDAAGLADGVVQFSRKLGRCQDVFVAAEQDRGRIAVVSL